MSPSACGSTQFMLSILLLKSGRLLFSRHRPADAAMTAAITIEMKSHRIVCNAPRGSQCLINSKRDIYLEILISVYMFGPHRIFTFLIEKTESIWYCSVYDVNFPHGRKKSNALFKKKLKRGERRRRRRNRVGHLVLLQSACCSCIRRVFLLPRCWSL